MSRKGRRLLNNSGNGVCEICESYNFLVQHHISGRKINRANKSNNLANVCSNCHLKIHKGEIIIEKRVLSTNGYILLWHKKGDDSITGEDSVVHMY